jgi:CO/xanthine dehydrogenase Mo-binding subunit
MWLEFNANETLTLRTGKVELGQGIKTALAIICAEELDLRLDRIVIESGDTETCPVEFMTAGSMSVEGSGSAIRQVSAEARYYLLKWAAASMNLPENELQVEDGMIHHPGSNNRLSYWELMQGRSFDQDASGLVEPKPAGQHSIVGRAAQRLDLKAKITGAPAFIQDQDITGMVHGRIMRPPGYQSHLLSLDNDLISRQPGVLKVIVDGSFVGVIAEHEYQAVKALEIMKLNAKWQVKSELPKPEDISEHLLTNTTTSLPVIDGMPVEEEVPEILTSDETGMRLAATYTKPFYMHGSLGPSAAIARWQNGKLKVWSHSQGPMVVRGALAQALSMEPEQIHVIHLENAGCYGHNGADDAALDACMLAKALPDSTVMLKWSREDEHSWEPYSPAMVMKLDASLDDKAQIVAWNHDVYSYTHMGRPVPFGSVSNFIAAWHRADPMPKPEARPGMMPHGGIHRNADPYYCIDNKRIIRHLVRDAPLRTSSTRGLGAFGNVFAIESFMDELAHEAGMNPVDFRLVHLEDRRAIELIEKGREAALEARQNQSRVSRDAGAWQTGSGMAFARYKNVMCYAAVFVDLAVNIDTFEIRLDHAVIAADAGQVIDPDGLANQLEGGFIQSASWTLKEQVLFDATGITSRDWETYPILTFPEIPTVDVILLDHPEHRSLGSGEATQGPTPAAIANAVFAATGLRVRDLPMKPDKLIAAALK